MRLASVLLLVVGACYRPALEESCSVRCDLSSGCPGAQLCESGFCRAPGVACGGDGGVVDVPLDQGRNTDGLFCFGNGQAPFTSVCLVDPPTAVFSFSGRLNTSTDCHDVIPQSGGPAYCLIAAGKITLGSVEAVGPRIPLVLATDTLVIDGPISVSGSLASATGSVPAGSSSCAASVGDDSQTPLGAGGGAGGSGGSTGGAGGSGESQSSAVPPPPQPALIVEGGCGGGNGGTSNGVSVLSGGIGGGAIYLMAGNRIQITGTIDASGSGGGGGGLGGGGSGGGAGGMIVLDATTIELGPNAKVFALGGGGGGGGSANTFGMAGGAPTGPGEPGTGGMGAGEDAGAEGATDGGAGGILDGAPGVGGGAGTGLGGGGGGGGGGTIRMSPLPSLGSSNVSPPAT